MCALRKPEILSIESQEANKGEIPEYLWKNFLMSPKSQQKLGTPTKLNRFITSEPLTMDKKETSQVNVNESSKKIKPISLINKMEEQSQRTKAQTMDRLRNHKVPTAERDIILKDDSRGIAGGEAPTCPLMKLEHASCFDKANFENAKHPGIDAETLVKLRLYYTMKGSEVAYFDDDRVPTDEAKKNDFAIKMVVEKTSHEQPKVTCIFHKPTKKLASRTYDATGKNILNQSPCEYTKDAVSLHGADKLHVVHSSSNFQKGDVPPYYRQVHARVLQSSHPSDQALQPVEKSIIQEPLKRNSSIQEVMKNRPKSTYDITGRNASLTSTYAHVEHAASLQGADKPEVVHSNSSVQKPIEKNLQEPQKISSSTAKPINVTHQTATKSVSNTSVRERVKHDASPPEGNTTNDVGSNLTIGEPVEKNKHHEPHTVNKSIHEPMKIQTSTSHENVVKKVTTPTRSREDMQHDTGQPKLLKAKLVDSSSIIRETRSTRIVPTLFIKKYATTNEPENETGTQPICFLEKHNGKLVRVEYTPAPECSCSGEKPLYQTRVLDVENANTDLSKEKIMVQKEQGGRTFFSQTDIAWKRRHPETSPAERNMSCAVISGKGVH